MRARSLRRGLAVAVRADPIAWGDYELGGFLATLHALKNMAMRDGDLSILGDDPVVQAASANPGGEQLDPVGGAGLYGIFNVEGHLGPVAVQLPDGRYDDLVSGDRVTVADGQLALPGPTAVLEFVEPFEATLWRSTLLDVFLHVEELGD